jgi:hypothetical protein
MFQKKLTYLTVIFLLMVTASCGIYKFNDTGGMDFTKVKTIKVGFIDNKASYINPQLAPKFTDRLQLRVLTGTKLTRTQDDNADIVVNSTIINYDATQTVGINAQQATINRLTVTVQVKLRKNFENTDETFTVSRSFDFPSSLSLQQAEGALLDDVVKSLSDEIFNKIFSNW